MPRCQAQSKHFVSGDLDPTHISFSMAPLKSVGPATGDVQSAN